MDKKIILVGGFHEIIELCENIGYTIIGIIDNNIEDHYLNYPILGRDEDAYEILNKNTNIPLVITPDSPLIIDKKIPKIIIFSSLYGSSDPARAG